MQLVEKTLKDTAQAISEEHTVDWSRMLDLIHLTVMEKSLKNQYRMLPTFLPGSTCTVFIL